jgi:hypothetical protein
MESWPRVETIELGDGKIATLSIVERESDKLGMSQLVVNGHKFTCAEKFREAFEEYFESIKSEPVELTFLHSVKPRHPDENRVAGNKGKMTKRDKNQQNPDQIFYNCTVQVSKAEALASFNNYVLRYDLLMAFNLLGGKEKFSNNGKTE